MGNKEVNRGMFSCGGCPDRGYYNSSLSLLHDEDERFDTAQEDLIFFRDCLPGEKSYGIKLEFISLTPEQKSK